MSKPIFEESNGNAAFDLLFRLIRRIIWTLLSAIYWWIPFSVLKRFSSIPWPLKPTLLLHPYNAISLVLNREKCEKRIKRKLPKCIGLTIEESCISSDESLLNSLKSFVEVCMRFEIPEIFIYTQKEYRKFVSYKNFNF